MDFFLKKHLIEEDYVCADCIVDKYEPPIELDTRAQHLSGGASTASILLSCDVRRDARQCFRSSVVQIPGKLGPGASFHHAGAQSCRGRVCGEPGPRYASKSHRAKHLVGIRELRASRAATPGNPSS